MTNTPDTMTERDELRAQDFGKMAQLVNDCGEAHQIKSEREWFERAASALTQVPRLLDDLDALRAENENVRFIAETNRDQRAALVSERDTLKARVERLEAGINKSLSVIAADEATILSHTDPEHCSRAECEMGRIILYEIAPVLRDARAALEASDV